MRYPKFLKSGDTIGVCAPSSGVLETSFPHLDNAIINLKKLNNYSVVESPSVRKNSKCVSADSETRAKEFMDLYENSEISAIIPPWGGEFLMDMLPFLDFEKISNLPTKWVSGFSDTSTLTFVLTVKSDIATVHGSMYINMGYATIHESDKMLFEVISNAKTTQTSAPFWGGYQNYDMTEDTYALTNKSTWENIGTDKKFEFHGRMIGGCMDTVCKLIGTKFAPVSDFIQKYKNDGFIWTLESCEMNAGDIYRTLWQMRECGWFEYCNGFIYGRADGYSDTNDFNMIDALTCALGSLDIPIIYNADVGHVPPQMQIVNGAFGKVSFDTGFATVTQELI